jgi:serine protease Do
MVIVELQQQAVSTAADFKARVDKLKKDGKKAAVLLVSNADGDTTFVALSLQ